MNFFQLLKEGFVSFIFENMDNYNSIIGNLEFDHQKFIAFIVESLSFIIPMIILLSIFIIPFYFILVAFNKVIKNLRTNVVTEETPRFKRKKR